MADRLPAQGTMLLGRGSECQVFDRLLDAARGGRSGTLVVRGEAGVGKTALLQYAIASASDLRVVRAAGVESEMELPFAALHQLCGPLLDGLERLPAPQVDALATAFGLRVGAPPDRFFVGLAVLSLLSEAAGERPLLCVVDDAQWLDRASAQTLAFVARRLFAESVVLMFAAREPGEELRGLPDLVVQGLPDRYARELLSEVVRWPLDVRVRDQILAETRGNPLALLELPRGLSPAQLAGGFGLPRAPSLSGRIEESFLRRLEALPPETQRLLLLAAVESTGDPSLLWRAAERLGIGRTALEPAQRAGLLEVGYRARFRHPLVRSAVYRAASAHERQDVHRVLAEAIDPETEPDRRAWHRAEATVGPDEDVAADLERSAGRARARGGLAASAAFLERAVRLTLDPALRTARALAAAQAKFEAAAPGVAYELLAIAELGPVDELQRARLERLRTQIAFAQKRSSDVPPLLLDTAKRLEPLDPQLARETYLEALGAAIFAGRESADRGVFEAAQAARAAPPAARPPRPIDLLLDGLTTRFTEPYAAALPPLRRALRAVLGDQRSEQTMRWPWLACPVTPEPLAPELWDDERWEELASRAVRLARDAGALTVLPIALTYRAHVHVHAGEFAAASALIDEADALARAAGNAPLRYTSLVLVAWRGDEATARNVIAASIQDATARGEGRAIGLAHYATAVLDNGLGRYGDALAAAQRACAHEDLAFFGWALIELVEAGARGDAHKVASDALCRLGERTRASGTDWALGIQARSEALLSEGEAAESLYREAIQRLARSRIAVHVARGHLVYGEWLRRERRRVDAREQLRTALEMFTGMGAAAFAERAWRELVATGERARKRTVETREDLTAQEARIARLARDGLSNPEIGARLFISPRTVEYHLHKVFAKLDISSRNELDRALPREPGTAVAV